MADITLAEYSGQAWLVRGEQHIDDLLANTLPPDVSIEVISCQSKSEVDAIWTDQGNDPSELWLIHPAITARSKGMANALAIVFQPWSASLDNNAQASLAIAAAALAKQPEATLALIRHIPDPLPPMTEELAKLRLGLIEASLATLGADPTRLRQETRPAPTPAHADQVALAMAVPT